MSNQELIPLKPLSKEEISNEGLDANELWVVKVHDEVYGPFKTIDLFNFSAEHPEICRQCEVRNPGGDEWSHFYKVPAFQRRKPQLISTQAFATDDKFFILINGIKKGPYQGEEVKNLLDQHEIMVTDQISVDGGNSWIKLYQHHQFDRRTRAGNKLPLAMKESFFIPKENPKLEIQDAIAGLVVEAKQDKIHEPNFKPMNTQFSTASSFKKWTWPMVITLVIVIGYSYMPNKQAETQEIVSTSTEAINNDERSVSRKPSSVDAREARKNNRNKSYPVAAPSRESRIQRLKEQQQHREENDAHNNYAVEETEVRNDYADTPEVDDRMPVDNYPPEAPAADQNRDIASEEKAEVEEIKEEMLDEIREMNNQPEENQTPSEEY